MHDDSPRHELRLPYRSRALASLVLPLALIGVGAARAWADPCPSWFFPAPGLRGGARLVGLGGAFVGLADDASASSSNPAGLLSLPRSLDGWVPLFGSGDPGWSPLFASLAFHPYKDLAVAADWGRSDRQAAFSLRGGCDGEASESGPGLAFSARRGRRLFFGGSVGFSRLTLREESATRQVQATAPRITAGVFLRPDSPLSPRLGLTYRRGAAWSTDASSDTGSEGIEVRQPTVISAGLSWYYDLIRNMRLTFSMQQDFVRYSELAEMDRARDGFDQRAGLEATIPFGCVSGCGAFVQARVGLLSRAAVPGAEPRGQDPSRQRHWFGGLSLALPYRWALAGKAKLDVAWSGEHETWLFGLGLRYPESYRADVVSNRVRKPR